MCVLIKNVNAKIRQKIRCAIKIVFVAFKLLKCLKMNVENILICTEFQTNGKPNFERMTKNQAKNRCHRSFSMQM